jgi:branched-chain amino acid transport system ATP-binding protein
MSLLQLENVTKRFGAVVANDDVSFTVESSDPVALIGPNGAGKTTLYNVISGRLSPSSGRILFKGEDVSAASPVERIRRGLGRSFQITNIFQAVSPRRNLRAAVIARTGHRFNPFSDVEQIDDINEETDRILEMVELTEQADRPCDTLPYGDQRRVELGISLATDPDMILLDEPTAGLNPVETESMVQLIDSLNEETDTTFLVTEHDMDVIFELASRIIVLDRGSVIADGSKSEIVNNDYVQQAYLGETVE